MKTTWLALLLFLAIPLAAEDWNPTNVDLVLPRDEPVNSRVQEVFKHGVKPEWGYAAPQQDTFIVIHPKVDRKNAPLYVVLHSAGHEVFSCVKCTRTPGNHDIYHSPEDMYALYLDCGANRGDWWWGGMHVKDPGLIKKNSGPNPMPVEKRVIDCVKWAIKKYEIDPNQVYLCGNSMGGTGTLGIGMRNGDVFAAIKANVPAGIEHVSNRMGFAPFTIPETVKIPDPPVCIDYSAQNDGWSNGHERFIKGMNEHKYALYFYWGPFGHANNHTAIMQVNDLINSFEWLKVKKNEAYPVFSNTTGNQVLPWPDDLKNLKPGQINAFLRWKNGTDTADKFEISLFLVTPETLKTKFEIPKEANADVTLRRLQSFQLKPGETFKWSFGTAKGEGKVDPQGLITIPGLKITSESVTLSVSK